MRKKERCKELQLGFILKLHYLLLALITIAVVGFFSYWIFSRIMTTQIAASRVDVLEQISERSNSTLNSANVISNFYFFNLPFHKSNNELSHSKVSMSQEELASAMFELDTILQQTVDATDLKFYYVISLNNGMSYSSQGKHSDYSIDNYQRKIWYSSIIEANGAPVLISTYKDFTSKEQYVFSIAKSIISPKTGESLGIFMINIKESNLSDTYNNFISNNSIYVIDKKGKIISHNNKDMLGISFYNMDRFSAIFQDADFKIIKKDKEKFLFSKYYNSELEWWVIEEIPLKAVLEPLNRIKWIIIIICIAVFLFTIVLANHLSKKIVYPLAVLCKELEQVGTQDVINKFHIHGWQEINQICEECNYMSDRINSLVADIKSEEMAKRHAELSFLQAQMNPHFVYNTLFSIKCLVDMNNKERALGIIDSFTSILKNMLTYKHKFLTVSEELTFLEHYITLQKYRYGDIFDFHVICPEECRSLSILRMLIQPLIENSIFHGLSEIAYRGIITLSFELSPSILTIYVSDNGLGISAAQIKQLESENSQNNHFHSNFIGIKNISDRIRLYFGESYSLTVSNETKPGTTVIITHPIMEAPGGHDND